MIVVDTSVWVAHFRNQISAAVAKLRAVADPEDIIVGDLILLECLQGARDENHARRLQGLLGVFATAPMLDARLAIDGARHYRTLRRRGITPRKTVDIVIATFCIDRGYLLLHQDRDFDAMAPHVGLRIM